MTKSKDGNFSTRFKLINRQINQSNNQKEVAKHTQDSTAVDLITADISLLGSFYRFCRTIASGDWIHGLDIDTQLNNYQLNWLCQCIRENRSIISVKFIDDSNLTNSQFNIVRFASRNLNVKKIIRFINENFTDNNDTEVCKNTNIEDYGYLKYCLPSNKNFIDKGLADLGFDGVYNWNYFLHMQFTFNLVCKDIAANGGLFALLPHELQTLTFSFVGDDGGTPYIGEHYHPPVLSYFS